MANANDQQPSQQLDVSRATIQALKALLRGMGPSKSGQAIVTVRGGQIVSLAWVLPKLHADRLDIPDGSGMEPSASAEHGKEQNEHG